MLCDSLHLIYTDSEVMMSTEPSAVTNGSGSFSVPSRPRRHKIFQQYPKSQPEPPTLQTKPIMLQTKQVLLQSDPLLLESKLVLHKTQQLLLQSKPSLQSKPPFQKGSSSHEQKAFLLQQRQYAATQHNEGKIQFIKVPAKDILQKDFYAEEEQAQTVVLLQPNLDGYRTIQSHHFGATDTFRNSSQPWLFVPSAQPSVYLRQNSLVINEQSELFQSVSLLKGSFEDLGSQTAKLSQSVAGLDASVSLLMKMGESSDSRLKEIEDFLNELQRQKEDYKSSLQELDRRIQNIEFRDSVTLDDLDASEQGQQLKIFMLSKGQQLELEQQSDQMVESQFLPASLIAEFMEQRRLKAQESSKLSECLKEEKEAGMFDGCLGVSGEVYSTLKTFICEQFAGKRKEEIRLQLVFKRSTVDLEDGLVGDKSSLEYKECLLFILRNGEGKTIGGFVSNYLIEGQIREDAHAFLFSLSQGCSKFRVREDCVSSAYEANKYYLVCFGSDLMLSADCITMESYCEWPNSYEGRHGHNSSVNWFAGDFSFTVEHIEVYEVLIDSKDPL